MKYLSIISTVIIISVISSGAYATVSAPKGNSEAVLYEAIVKSDIPKVKKLIDNGLDVNKMIMVDHVNGEAKYPLFLAVIQDEYEVIDLLLSNGANLEARNETGMTVLGVAAWLNDLKMVKYLLERGAKINVTRADTNPNLSDDALSSAEEPLFWAMLHGNIELAKLLLSKGANIKTGKNGIGQAGLLDGAIRSGNAQVLKLLIEKGIDVNVELMHQNGRSELPVFSAIKSENPEMLEILIKAGASTDIKNEQGKTPHQVVDEKLKNISALQKILKQ